MRLTIGKEMLLRPRNVVGISNDTGSITLRSSQPQDRQSGLHFNCEGNVASSEATPVREKQLGRSQEERNLKFGCYTLGEVNIARPFSVNCLQNTYLLAYLW